MGSSDYEAEFMRRTKWARLAKGLKQRQVGVVLDMDQGTYKQYETRTPLPHRYLVKFCTVCDIDANWLVTGEGKRPASLFPKPSKRRKRAA